MKKRKALADALADVARNSRAAFAEGWGLAVMFALSGKRAVAQMDLSAGALQQHHESKQPALVAGRV
jgi:hypothetical protein